MKIFLSTWTEQNQGETLNKVGIKHRLLSYYFLQDCPDEWLLSYFKNGIGKGRIKKIKSEIEEETKENE